MSLLLSCFNWYTLWHTLCHTFDTFPSYTFLSINHYSHILSRPAIFALSNRVSTLASSAASSSNSTSSPAPAPLPFPFPISNPSFSSTAPNWSSTQSTWTRQICKFLMSCREGRCHVRWGAVRRCMWMGWWRCLGGGGVWICWRRRGGRDGGFINLDKRRRKIR